MVSLVLLFTVTLSVIMFVSTQEIRQKNMDVLNRYASQYSLEKEKSNSGEQNSSEGQGSSEGKGSSEGQKSSEGQSPQQPLVKPDAQLSNKSDNQPPGQRSAYELSTFYSVSFSADGSVLSVFNGEKTVSSDENLTEFARQILNEGNSSGRTGNLSYVVMKKDGYTLVAFMDNTVSEAGLQTMMRNALLVGGASLVVMFFISVFLAKRIIRPLEESDKKQKQFISDASHELKTPIAVIDANAEILSRELSHNEWLSNIQYESNRMGKLVKQLLDFSSAENREVPMEKLDFSHVVTGESLVFETFAFENGKVLQSNIEEGIVLTGNQNQLTQVISVLLDNALRHATGTQIELNLKKQGHSAILSVSNGAEEISQEKLEHLFDRFYRVDDVRNSEDNHYGLGLSIAQAVVQKHGGTINVSYSEGKIIFTVQLPIKGK